MDHPLWIIAVLGAMVAASEWLARNTPARHLGSALLVIVLTAVVANLGVVPSVTEGSPVYDGVFATVAPLAIFWLLLHVDLRGIVKAGVPMLLMFALGTTGTMVGVLLGMQLIGGATALGDLHDALGGMFTGTYIGGSVNFNAVALHYRVVDDGLIYAGSAVVDNIATTVWMAVSIVLPRFLLPLRVPRYGLPRAHTGETEHVVEASGERIAAADLALLTALGAGTVWLSERLADWSLQTLGVGIPSILILTTLALAMAQTAAVRRIKGAYLLGWFSVLLFLAVIGALCDVGALAEVGTLGPRLLGLVTVIIIVHGLMVFGGGLAMRMDPAVTAVASQANIGGAASALALARSLERPDLVLPSILVGTLGYAVGTYLGFLMAALL